MSFWLLIAVLFGAATAHAQNLEDPALLARYMQLETAAWDTQGTAEAFDEFTAIYLAAAQATDHGCLFGCRSGFSGDSPDHSGAGYLEFLARTDLLSLAVKLSLTSQAVSQLSASVSLLRPQWELYSTVRSEAIPDDQKFDLLINSSWADYAGCTAVFTRPENLAESLVRELEKLRTDEALSEAQSSELDSIDQALAVMSAYDD